MNKIIFILIFLFTATYQECFCQLSIYEIQYTDIPGDGTYPSKYEGQYVTTGGIVTAIGFEHVCYFISSSEGGPWNSILINDYHHSPAIGDSIIISGLVIEERGFTEITNLTEFEIISSDNPLPEPEQITTGLVSNEASEGQLVEINNITVTNNYDRFGVWGVDDGSGECSISYEIYHLQMHTFPVIPGYQFESITGVVVYRYDSYRINPREINDLISKPDTTVIWFNQLVTIDSSEFKIPVKISMLNQEQQVSDYDLYFSYNSEMIEYKELDIENTLSVNGTINDQSIDGYIEIGFLGNFNYSGIDTIVNVIFSPLSSGYSLLKLDSAKINGEKAVFTYSGELEINLDVIPIGDTITIIQRPLINIPTIVTPGDELEITCLAPSETTGWQAELIHDNHVISLEIISEEYNNELGRWYLKALLPQSDIYELYDLKVIASNDIEDISKNSVQFIPEYKENYYFVQITDTHLPAKAFYNDPGEKEDTSEMTDFHEVINDINLIRPEFVLLTGDFIHNAKIEDYGGRRVFTRAQRILSELEVPVFLVSGNHDLGGRVPSPLPASTSRKEWWRFFGWSWLQNPPASEPHYTQDYSFDYGSVHFIGFEAYTNYDWYKPEIYGYESLIPSQLDWFEKDLLEASESEAIVLFNHYNSAEFIDLELNGIDMSLYGHNHLNSGSIEEYPYILCTDNACDGERAYRVIKVNNAVLAPQNTTYAGSEGGNLSISFYPSNNGSSEIVTATINNQHNLSFENAKILFYMPKGDLDFSVQNGILEQVDQSGEIVVCYVNVVIPAQSSISVTIKIGDEVSVSEPETIPKPVLYQNYPNPVSSKTIISYQLTKSSSVDLEIYTLTSQRVTSFVSKKLPAGNYQVEWDATDTDNGVYFYRLRTDNFELVRKLIVLH
ncbi:metallophosphoesterase [Bacteroidota bacterium]